MSAALENILALIAGLIRRAKMLKSLASASKESQEIPGEMLAVLSTLLRPHPAAASMTSRTHVAWQTKAASETRRVMVRTKANGDGQRRGTADVRIANWGVNPASAAPRLCAPDMGVN